MLIGYARVSTDDQNLDLQRDALRLAQPPPPVRFQAERANDCWQFDMSPSDLKQVPAPLWVEPGRRP